MPNKLFNYSPPLATASDASPSSAISLAFHTKPKTNFSGTLYSSSAIILLFKCSPAALAKANCNLFFEFYISDRHATYKMSCPRPLIYPPPECLSQPLQELLPDSQLPPCKRNYNVASLKAQNIQLFVLPYPPGSGFLNPENQSLMLYEYPAYSDANGVSRPVLVEDLAQASNANVVFLSCWCPAAFTGEYCETIIFTMSPLTNAEYENLGKLALHCAALQPKLRLFGCGFFIPIQQLTSQGALRNPLCIPAPGLTKSASSLLHALDESFVGSSKHKFAVKPNGSPKKSQVLMPDSDTDFSPPPPSVLGSKKAIAQDTMFKAAFLQEGSLCSTSTIEEFFQGMATFSAPSLHALEEVYMSGRGISLQEFRYLTDYCLECGKVFKRLAHNKHLCFEVSQTQSRCMHIPKTEKGNGKARASSDIFMSTPLDDVIVICSDSE
ncbi:hypothetical protein EDD18DRAFT_1118487 [Armillaria luteobubalina]|uniref:Uncharacterized protein n=1 Tax=Armillaria luteobubalina TaxID=153913 RepID=A0AA39UBB4_9AGAR|nr:hypothetical protein EDD18DRAFT_1118487 [Armillaria luteobubalina]